MKCPYCDAENNSFVVDTSRGTAEGIRRRRECKACGRRFSTFERVIRSTPLLIKANGDREAFDREKLIRGIQISCAKRPIQAAGISNLADRIEAHLQNMGRDEVPSRVVGDMVIEGLKDLDPIAYIRYAIVYLGLDNLASVRDMLDTLLGDQSVKAGNGTAALMSTGPADDAAAVFTAKDAERAAVPSPGGSDPEVSTSKPDRGTEPA
ncbi:MAG: transcriptional regulator NrdR [Bacillota bacterium]